MIRVAGLILLIVTFIALPVNAAQELSPILEKGEQIFPELRRLPHGWWQCASGQSHPQDRRSE